MVFLFVFFSRKSHKSLFTLKFDFLIRPLKMGRRFVFGCFSFFFIFGEKSGTTNNDRTGLSDILY